MLVCGDCNTTCPGISAEVPHRARVYHKGRPTVGQSGLDVVSLCCFCLILSISESCPDTGLESFRRTAFTLGVYGQERR